MRRGGGSGDGGSNSYLSVSQFCTSASPQSAIAPDYHFPNPITLDWNRFHTQTLANRAHATESNAVEGNPGGVFLQFYALVANWLQARVPALELRVFLCRPKSLTHHRVDYFYRRGAKIPWVGPADSKHPIHELSLRSRHRRFPFSKKYPNTTVSTKMVSSVPRGAISTPRRDCRSRPSPAC